ncbi:SIR2 family NAD-dependent protein deacylase [Paracoccus laeviglucosivorans]|uniref:SIR2-like domain-containing protein n=1 Tax=Paracoccus laeviglucosivorans TaxID=1197861 RepID=A0A521FUM9_9RHOB|nr:SIR2 family protein [Paracoccus laeviglucosivorans]SMO99251.1 SIR2-like domain-containing protein [Paracoccus laeviglucosivorans]
MPNETIHNPDQYMTALRTIIAGGRKRIGLLLGAGASAGMRKSDGSYPLIPAVAGLTTQVLGSLNGEYQYQIAELKKELAPKDDIETILSRVRALAKIIGPAKIHGLDGPQYATLGERICEEIGTIVNVSLPPSGSAYSDIVTWIVGTARDHPVEIFTTNYDLLMEEALERVRAPYFDGFTGGRDPFFDPVTVSNNDLPARWTRLWKLHGSLGWSSNDKDEVVRSGKDSAKHLVFPEHLKYEQTQKAPYAALLDRLRAFLATPDTLLISVGFSFADAHISARIDEGLAANPSASVFAFQFQKLEKESCASELGRRLPNFSVYARDAAVVNGSAGLWKVPDQLPSKDWGPIRSSYWSRFEDASPNEFILGRIEDFARFFSAARSAQAFAAQQTQLAEPNTALPAEAPVA